MVVLRSSPSARAFARWLALAPVLVTPSCLGVLGLEELDFVSGGVDDGGADDALDGAPSDVIDAAADAPVLLAPPPCPRPRAPKGACATDVSACTRTRIHESQEHHFPFGIVADARAIYWLAQDRANDGYNGESSATLYRLDRSSGSVVELARDQARSRSLTVVGADLYWDVWPRSGASGSSLVWRLRKDASPCESSGCPAATPVTAVPGRIGRNGLVAAGGDALFIFEEEGSVYRASVSRPPPTATVIGGVAGALSAAAINGEIFVTSPIEPGIHRFSTTAEIGSLAASFPAVDSGVIGASAVATDCTRLFAYREDDTLFHVPVADGGTFEYLSTMISPLNVYAMSSDASFLYAGSANARGLWRIDTTLGKAELLGAGSVWGMAVTDDEIVYGDHGTMAQPDENVGAIFVVAK